MKIVEFKPKDRVVVVLARGGLPANVGDTGTVVSISHTNYSGEHDDPCRVRVVFDKYPDAVVGCYYDNQFAHLEGPW